ncbi:MULTISPECIES: DUF6408 family protein [Kitasatospora]|nr:MULTISPECIES: DUF6408 family protein [Kitasatospora]
MAVVEYARKHRSWIRDVLVGAAAGFGSNLAWMLAQFVVHRLG